MKTLVDRIKSGARDLVVGGVVGAAALGLGASVRADGISVSGFKNFVGTAGVSKSVKMEYGDNLMERDPNGIAEVVEKNGTNVWRMGFVKYVEGGMIFGGYANNDNNYSNKYLGYEGWCKGRFYDPVFAEGDSADDVLIIHDQLGDGIGSVGGGVWTLGLDDVMYWTEDIEFNGVQGDIGQLEPFSYTSGTKILPQMTINTFAGPVLREGPYGVNDLVYFAAYWLSGCEEGNSYCDGLDFNGDGKIDFGDFAHMAKEWEPGHVASADVSSKSLEDSVSKAVSMSDESGIGQDSLYLVSSIRQGDREITFEE